MLLQASQTKSFKTFPPNFTAQDLTRVCSDDHSRPDDAVKRASQSDEQKDQAGDEMRTYMEILLTSAPVLINADRPRAFLESAQRLAALLVQAMRDDKDEHATPERLDRSLQELRDAEAPLLDALSPQQRAAVSSVTADPSDG